MSGSTDKWHAIGDGLDDDVVVVVVCDSDGDVGEVIEVKYKMPYVYIYKSNIK